MLPRLMLPPGADGKQHPGFPWGQDNKPYYAPFHSEKAYGTAWPLESKDDGHIRPIAASAIANYWDDFFRISTEKYLKAWADSNDERSWDKRMVVSEYQRNLWKRVARGEHIEGAVIVPLKWE